MNSKDVFSTSIKSFKQQAKLPLAHHSTGLAEQIPLASHNLIGKSSYGVEIYS
jgi:hypothetical protein